MTITTVGIDLAKNVFAVHCVDQGGQSPMERKRTLRA
jgi:transposase